MYSLMSKYSYTCCSPYHKYVIIARCCCSPRSLAIVVWSILFTPTTNYTYVCMYIILDVYIYIYMITVRSILFTLLDLRASSLRRRRAMPILSVSFQVQRMIPEGNLPKMLLFTLPRYLFVLLVWLFSCCCSRLCLCRVIDQYIYIYI